MYITELIYHRFHVKKMPLSIVDCNIISDENI